LVDLGQGGASLGGGGPVRRGHVVEPEPIDKDPSGLTVPPLNSSAPPRVATNPKTPKGRSPFVSGLVHDSPQAASEVPQNDQEAEHADEGHHGHDGGEGEHAADQRTQAEERGEAPGQAEGHQGQVVQATGPGCPEGHAPVAGLAVGPQAIERGNARAPQGGVTYGVVLAPYEPVRAAPTGVPSKGLACALPGDRCSS